MKPNTSKGALSSPLPVSSKFACSEILGFHTLQWYLMFSIIKNSLYFKFCHNFKLAFYGLVAKLCPILLNPWTAACQAPQSKGFSRQEY